MPFLILKDAAQLGPLRALEMPIAFRNKDIREVGAELYSRYVVEKRCLALRGNPIDIAAFLKKISVSPGSTGDHTLVGIQILQMISDYISPLLWRSDSKSGESEMIAHAAALEIAALLTNKEFLGIEEAALCETDPEGMGARFSQWGGGINILGGLDKGSLLIHKMSLWQQNDTQPSTLPWMTGIETPVLALDLLIAFTVEQKVGKFGPSSIKSTNKFQLRSNIECLKISTHDRDLQSGFWSLERDTLKRISNILANIGAQDGINFDEIGYQKASEIGRSRPPEISDGKGGAAMQLASLPEVFLGVHNICRKANERFNGTLDLTISQKLDVETDATPLLLRSRQHKLLLSQYRSSTSVLAWIGVKATSEILSRSTIRPDLSGLDLSRIDFKRINMEGIQLTGTILRGANLQGVNLSGAVLKDADLQDANLEGATLKGANLTRANLRNANLNGVDATGANMRWVDLSGALRQGFIIEEVALFGMACESTSAPTKHPEAASPPTIIEDVLSDRSPHA